jgi:carbamoyl-phosphate synthase large subunit
MKSTGEVMGVAENFPAAFGKAVAAAGQPLPTEGSVFLSVCDTDKSAATILAQRLHSLGFEIYATRGTATALTSLGIPVHVVNKVFQGEPNVVNLIESGEIVLVVNTPMGRGARTDGYEIRTTALRKGISSITTLAGASAAVSAIEAARRPRVQVHCLQDLHAAAEE